MSLADWMNDIDGGYAERERMAAFGVHELYCECPACEQERLCDDYDQYLSNPNIQEEE